MHAIEDFFCLLLRIVHRPTCNFCRCASPDLLVHLAVARHIFMPREGVGRPSKPMQHKGREASMCCQCLDSTIAIVAVSATTAITVITTIITTAQ